MPKIDRAHKNHLKTEICEETNLREIFYGTLIFQQRLAAMLEGTLLPSNMAAENCGRWWLNKEGAGRNFCGRC